MSGTRRSASVAVDSGGGERRVTRVDFDGKRTRTGPDARVLIRPNETRVVYPFRSRCGAHARTHASGYREVSRPVFVELQRGDAGPGPRGPERRRRQGVFRRGETRSNRNR